LRAKASWRPKTSSRLNLSVYHASKCIRMDLKSPRRRPDVPLSARPNHLEYL
jgi:hypothetical protein